jgi:hypothetical protein
MHFDVTATFAQVLEAAQRLADEHPNKVTIKTYWLPDGSPYDLVASILADVGFRPTDAWRELHGHQHVMFWGNQAFSDWAVKVFMTRLQKAIDSGKTWHVALKQALSQTKSYYRSPVNSYMIALMSQEGYYPDSTKPEDVLR